mgnify:CR=1 FL=1
MNYNYGTVNTENLDNLFKIILGVSDRIAETTFNIALFGISKFRSIRGMRSSTMMRTFLMRGTKPVFGKNFSQ